MAKHDNAPTMAQATEVLNLLRGQERDRVTKLLSSGILAELFRSDPSQLYGLSRKPVLCYVEGEYAYFTTQEPSRQLGDDWDDAPYEHNAGTPYDPCWHNKPEEVRKRRGVRCGCPSCERDWNRDGTPRWKIVKVFWRGPLETPADKADGNSDFSVDDINSQMVPWLSGRDGFINVKIWSGTTLEDFVRAVQSIGGMTIVRRSAE